MVPTFNREVVGDLQKMLAKTPRLIQVVSGPRQVGKTTAALEVARQWEGAVRYAAADQFLPPSPAWIRSEWGLARGMARDRPVLLILDEVQKITGWSEVVKAEWDEDRREGRDIRVVLLGSSALLLSQGSSDLAGRFFLHRCPHWSFEECRRAFGWDFDRWIYFGGYPGIAPVVDDEEVFKTYVRDSLIEAGLARDVLALHRIVKPALLRQVFVLACRYPARVLSYNKMLGQLQDAGNTVTLAHYLRLLETAFLVSGIEPFSGDVRSRGGIPKLIVWNNALVSAMEPRPFAQVRADPSAWGRLVENAVGGHLLNRLPPSTHQVRYWRHRNMEVDFVVSSGRVVHAIEVKTGPRDCASGLDVFLRLHPRARPLVIGPGGLALEDFFRRHPGEFLA